MEAETEVRERTDEDIPALADILVRVHAADGYPVEGVSDPAAWLRSTALIGAWVAHSGGVITGHVWLTHPTSDDGAALIWSRSAEGQRSPAAVLGRLFVDPRSRSHGAGRLLTKAATGAAQAKGYRPVLDVMTKDRSAIQLYESLGWQRIGEITHRLGDTGTEPAYAYVGPST